MVGDEEEPQIELPTSSSSSQEHEESSTTDDNRPTSTIPFASPSSQEEQTSLLPTTTTTDTPTSTTSHNFPFRLSGRTLLTTTVLLTFALMSMATVVRQHRLSNTRTFLHKPAAATIATTTSSSSIPTPATSYTYSPDDIYCRGPILHTIQMMDVQHMDGKDFVDRPMKYDPDHIMASFHSLPDHTVPTLQRFLDDNFYAPGSDLIPVLPTDFQAQPPLLLSNIQNSTLLEWALELNGLWKLLGRQPDSNADPRRHSFLPTNHLLVVPGGRFRESYYWDTYWIVHGLLACGMGQTARGVVQNLLDWVDLYGFVPNGGRIYFLNRSQPPLLSEMVRIVYDYMETHGDEEAILFLRQATATLDTEYAFWMRQNGGHGIAVGEYVLNRYVASTDAPRPESYREDVETAAEHPQQQHVYAELIAACESGWDFSSRWLEKHDDLSSARTSHVLPVDLNAILHRMEQTMVDLHSILGHEEQANMYRQAAVRRQAAIEEILWDPETSMWRDVILSDDGSTRQFSSVLSASNYFPLWSKSFDTTDTARIEAITASLENSHLIGRGGIAATTTTDSQQQWDMPNAWAPLQDILIEGLLQFPASQPLAHKLIQEWLQTNYNAWKVSGHMMEKYDSETGDAGGGGEYTLQYGFGWTNGVILKWLVQQWDQLKV